MERGLSSLSADAEKFRFPLRMAHFPWQFWSHKKGKAVFTMMPAIMGESVCVITGDEAGPATPDYCLPYKTCSGRPAPAGEVPSKLFPAPSRLLSGMERGDVSGLGALNSGV